MIKGIRLKIGALAAVGIAAASGVAQAGGEMVDVELTKLDGTKMTRTYEKPRYGGTITMNREILLVTFSNWDPRGGGGPHELANLQPTNQRLTQLDWARGASGTGDYPNFVAATPPLYIAPMLAESWEMPNDTTLRFKMREGVHFWEKDQVAEPNPGLEADYGRELTAHDAAWSKSTLDFMNTGDQGNVTWTAIDDHTLELTWPTPDATMVAWNFSQYQFIYNSGMANISEDSWGDWKNALGTGAYIPTDFIPGSVVTYKRNDNYWENDPIHTENRLPYADTLRVIDFDDEASIVAALRAGQIDLTNGLGTSGKFGLQLKKTNPEIGQFPAAATPSVFVPRVDLADNPFSDIKVRQALMMAIPREEILENVYGGFGSVYSFPTFPNFTDWFVKYEDLPTEPMVEGSCASAKEVVTYNPDKARECLAAAGYPDGFDFPLVAPPGEAEFAEMYAGVWQEIGARADLQVVEGAVWQSIKDRDDHLGMVTWTPGTWQDPFVNLNLFLYSKGGINSARVNDPVYDAMVPVLKNEMDNEKRKAAYAKVFSYALEDSSYLHGVSFDKLTFWHPWVKGYSGEISNVGIQGWHSLAKNIWIDTDMQPGS